MQRIGLLNGNNITYDKDLSAAAIASITDGVISGLYVSGSGASASIEPGRALVLVTRANGDQALVHYENTTSAPINMTGTKKVYIEVSQSAIDDGSANAENGVGIGQITTGADYPASNYLPLYSVAGGDVTDARHGVRSKTQRSNMASKTITASDASGEEVGISYGSATEGQALIINSGGVPRFASIPPISIGSLPTGSALAPTDKAIVFQGGTAKSVLVDVANRGNIELYTAGEAIAQGAPVAYYGADDVVGSAYGHNGGNYHKVAVALDNTRTLIAYTNGAGSTCVRVATRGAGISDTTITYGTEYSIVNSGTNTYLSLCALTPTTAVLTLIAQGSTYCPSVAMTISGTTITFGSLKNGPSGTAYQYSENTTTRISNTQCVVLVHNYNQTRIEGWILTVSGTTISVGTLYNLVSVALATASACLVSANKILLMLGASYYVVTVSGSILSISSAVLTGVTGAPNGVCVRTLSTDKAIAIATITGSVYAQVVTISGTTVTPGTAVTLLSATISSAWSAQITYESPSVVWLGYGVYVRPASISGTTITIGTQTQPLTSLTAYLSMTDSIVGRSMMIGAASAYLAKISPLTAGYHMATSNHTEGTAVLGFALNPCAAGEQVMLEHCRAVPLYTGLTPGSTYYVGATAGTISTTPTGTNKVVGRAVSTTTLLPIL